MFISSKLNNLNGLDLFYEVLVFDCRGLDNPCSDERNKTSLLYFHLFWSAEVYIMPVLHPQNSWGPGGAVRLFDLFWRRRGVSGPSNHIL